MLFLSVVNRLIVIFALSISMLCVAAEPTKKETTEQDTWQEWNSTPTPGDGRRVEDYYPFGEYYCTDANTYIRTEFELESDPADARLVFYSYLDINYAKKTSFVHEIYVNSTQIYKYPKQGESYESLKHLVIIPVSGLRKGKNVLWAKTAWSSIKLIANGADGSQRVVNISPAWRASAEKHPGWDEPGYKGSSSEIVYRLGREGYHCSILPYMCHPYLGIIDLQKDKDIPVYRAGETAKWLVSIPAPFYAVATPELEYRLEECFSKGKEGIKGKAVFLESKNGKRVYEMVFTVPPVGAYDVTISFGDKPAMERKEELVATGSIAQPSVDDARKLFSSLDLTKIDDVDCSDTGDKAHEFMEGRIEGKEKSSGKVVTNKGMTYFETGTATGFLVGLEKTDYAMWKLKLKDLNEWHLVEVDIPDDKDRVQIVGLIHNIATREHPVESTIELGAPRPSTNAVYTHRMLFIPKFHDVRLMIAPSPARRDILSTAAAKAIRVYKINGILPAVKFGNSGRMSSTYNERSNLIAVSFYPGSDGINEFSGNQILSPCQYRRWFLAIEKHVEYLRFSGHNAVCHGIYQYTKEEYPTSKWQTDYIAIMLDMYHANKINFYCNSEYMTSELLEGVPLGHRIKNLRISDEQVAEGADSCRLVSNTGAQAVNELFNNPCHPELKKDVSRVVGDVARRYGAHPAFKGMMVFAGTMGCSLNFKGPNFGYDDCSYNLFKSESRKDAPVFEGKDRFQKRYNWIKSNSWDDWEKFRCRKVYELNKHLAGILTTYSPTSKLLVNICAWPWQKNIGEGTVEELRAKLIGTGTDPLLYQNDPDMLVLHNDWQGQHITGKELAFVERYNNDKRIWDYVTGGKSCGVFFWTGFYEMALYLPRELSNQRWYDETLASKYGVNIEKRFIGSAGRCGRNYLSPYSTAFAYTDPIFFANRFTDVAEHRGFEDVRAEAGQAMSYIPMGAYSIQEGSTHRLVMKRCGDNAYIVNNSSTSLNAPVVVSASGFFSPSLRNAVTGRKFDLERISGTWFSSASDYLCELKLEPYQILPLKLEGILETKIQNVSYPSATLSNGAIDLVVYLPDAEKAYYRGTRFDGSSLITKLSYKGHSWFGNWKNGEHNPLVTDDVSGPASEFGNGHGGNIPLGYNEATPGDTFIKIGVGELRKPKKAEKAENGRTQHRYEMNYSYEIERFFPWLTQKGDDWIEFVQESPNVRGYRYRLTRRIELTESPAGFVMKCRLDNLGEKAIKQNYYEHNFINVDGNTIDPEWKLVYPYKPVLLPTKHIGNYELFSLIEREIRIKRVFSGEEYVDQHLGGFSSKSNDNTVIVFNDALKTGLRISGDQPIVYTNLFCTSKTICPELFIDINVPAGSSMRWQSNYEFTHSTE